MKRSGLKFILSMCVSMALLYYTLRYFDIEKTFAFIRSARADYLILSLGLIVVAYLLRGYRWMIWERDLTYRDSLELILIGFMGNNLLPARLGELLRAYCTGHKTGEGYGGTAALASIAIERILDGFIIAVFGLLGLAFISIDDLLHKSLLIVSALFGFLTLSLFLSIFFHKKIRNGLDAFHRIFPGHLTRFGKQKISFFLDGLLLLGSIWRTISAIIFTGIIWSTEVIAYYFVANAVYSGVTLKLCCIFLAVVNFASLFPFTIGGIGVIEGAAGVFLVSAGIPGDQALAMVLIQHVFQFGFTTLTGGAIYFAGGYYNISACHPEREKGPDQQVCPGEGGLILKNTRAELKALSCKLPIHRENEKEVFLSIVIPAYNEQSRLPKTVLETIGWCARKIENYELIIADDGSQDDTPEIARLFASQVDAVRYIACPHQGKGATVRIGMLNAVGKYVLFMDADGATPLDEIPKLIAEIETGADIVIGSRVVQSPDETSVITSLHRKVMGRVFSGLVNLFVVSGIADTQCGFKLFRQEVVRRLFVHQKIDGFAFDVEILYLARKMDLSVAEVAVNWVNQEGSKVNLFIDSAKMFLDLLRIKWVHKNQGIDLLIKRRVGNGRSKD